MNFHVFGTNLILLCEFSKVSSQFDTKLCVFIHTCTVPYCIVDILFVFVTLVANSEHLWHLVVYCGLMGASYTGTYIPCDLIYIMCICSKVFYLVNPESWRKKNSNMQIIYFSWILLNVDLYRTLSICWISTCMLRNCKP